MGVDFLELGLEVLWHTVTELLDGVDTCLLEQLGKLRSYTIYAEQISVVGPAQNQLLGDTSGLGQFLAPLRRSTLCQQFANLVDTSSNQFLGVNVANTFDVNNLVIHNYKVFS